MSPAVLCAVMLTVSVDYGYEAMPGDGIRYVIRVEPDMIDLLQRGEPIGSTIPPEVRGRIHAFRIVSNYNSLSKEVPPPIDDPAADVREPELPDPISSPERKPAGDGTTSLEPAPKLLPRKDEDVQPASAQEESPAPLDGPSGEVHLREAEKEETSGEDRSFLLVLATLLAAGSSTGMLYFGWLAFDYRSRYLGLLREGMDRETSWRDEPLGQDLTSDAERSWKSNGDGIDGSVASGPNSPSDSSDTSEDAAWNDLGSESSESLDDWLNEDLDQVRRSRRKRKKSR